MQIIRAVPVSAIQYVSRNFQRNIEPPDECPHCRAQNTLEALCYYSRNVTNVESGVLRISIRRFRCRACRKTVSILPSFVQPYRLVLNVTISDFFGGTLSTRALSWLHLLKQYWNRFSKWLPRVDLIVRSVVARAPPHPDADGWWEVLAGTFGDLERITAMLVGRFGVTLFGRYRCHSPCFPGPPTN
jgi:hypothetical protein